MKLSKYLLCFLAASFLLVGCSQEAVDRAKAAQADAEKRLAIVQAASVQAEQALEQIKALALVVGGEKAAAMVKVGEHSLEVAKDGERAAQALADATGRATAAAERSQAAGGTTFDVILGILQSLALGAAPVLAVVLPIVNKYRKALTVTAAHADRMEEATTPAEIEAAKKISIAEQAAGGLTAIIAKARA